MRNFKKYIEINQDEYDQGIFLLFVLLHNYKNLFKMDLFSELILYFLKVSNAFTKKENGKMNNKYLNNLSIKVYLDKIVVHLVLRNGRNS